MTTKNEPVGDSECPIKGCAESVPVFKYRDASGDSKKRRFAGRLYCACPVHGRVENQEYLLEHMKWRDGKKDTGGTTPTTPAPEIRPPAPTQAAPVKPRPSTREPTVTTGSQKKPPAPSEPPPSKEKKSSWLPDFWSEK